MATKTNATSCPDHAALLAAIADDDCPAEVTLHVDECQKCRERIAVILSATCTAHARDDCNEALLISSVPTLEDVSDAGRQRLYAHFERCADCRDAAMLGLESMPSSTTPLSPMNTVPVLRRERYTNFTELGSGGMGRVWVAYDQELRRRVVIKEPWLKGNKSSLDRRSLHRRIKREAILTAGLTHPSIVSVHQSGRWSTGTPFYVMELVDGRPLQESIDSCRSSDDRLKLLTHVISASEAVAYAHGKGVMHCDLKPHNILVGQFGETVVIDWGLAQRLAPTDHFDANESSPAAYVDDSSYLGPEDGGPESTQSKTTHGTPAYMAPELIRGEGATPKSEVFALGAVLLHVVSGSPPVGSKAPLSTSHPGVPRELQSIIRRAMAPRPDDRYSDVGQFAAHLRQFQNGQLVEVHNYSRLDLLARWVARNFSSVVIALVASGLIAASIVLSLLRVQDEEARRKEAELAAEKGDRALPEACGRIPSQGKQQQSFHPRA